MQAAGEAGEVFSWLEGWDLAEAAQALFGPAAAGAREAWLARALLHYHARTGSQRALDLLARAPDPHAKHLLDALADQLRADSQPPLRHQALAALAPLVARRPSWLHRLPPHPLARELLRSARTEREALPLLHALLALATLLPAAPAWAAPHWPELADALLRPAALAPPPPPPVQHHLQLAQLALFHALYATHPVTLLDTLRTELNSSAARDAWERGLAPLLTSVRLHPALVTGSRQREADLSRWARVEAHDVVAEARRLSLRTPERKAIEPAPSPAPAPTPLPSEPPPGSGGHAARLAASLRPGAEPWFPLGERCGAESAPATPLPSDPSLDGEPPEAAVEATPENTPAKETRLAFRFPAESGAVRAIGWRSRPPSPPRKDTSPPVGAGGAEPPLGGRLSRVLAERRAAESPVPFLGAPPLGASVARPEPNRPPPLETEPLNVEDREVLELTLLGRRSEAWPERSPRASAGSVAAALDPRRLWPSSPNASRGRAPARAAPPLRASSCSPHTVRPRSRSVASQTVDVWPEPYEFLVADFYRSLPQCGGEGSGDRSQPSDRLDAYLAQLYAGGGGGVGSGSGGVSSSHQELAEQLALAHAQLMYERWRREAHAERSRRLLGRCRQARALELQNAALRERLHGMRRDCDELRARLQRESAHGASSAHARAEHERERLEAELAEQRVGRARAEAALAEAEARRARDSAELQRQRGESFEAARQVEALARAVLAAERRADHVKRLRRELLVLAEREARLLGAVQSAQQAHEAAPAHDERALRAQLARAEADAAAAQAKADSASARAHELEATLSARDAQLAELKRAARHVADEQAARLRALHDKYAALMRVLRAAEGRLLQRQADAVAWPARAPPPPPPPADHDAHDGPSADVDS